MSDENAALGQRMVGLLGPVAARQLLDVLTRSEEDRAALIGRLSQREDATWLAEILIRSPLSDVRRDLSPMAMLDRGRWGLR